MGLKEALKQAMDAMPTRAEVQEQAVQEVGNAKSFLGNALSEIGQELGRMGVQGQAELAGALFNGNAFVPYGEGQKPPETPEAEQQKEQERGGMEM